MALPAAATTVFASSAWAIARAAIGPASASSVATAWRCLASRGLATLRSAASADLRQDRRLSERPPDSETQAFLRTRMPILAALGCAAAGTLAYTVFHEPAVTQRVALDFEVDGAPAGRVVVGLYGKEAPHTCSNFAALAAHEGGFGYAGCPVHRVAHGWSVWTGDVTAGDGSGGVAAVGPSLGVEARLRHVRGAVSMVLDAEDRIRSQFFFTLVTTPALDRKAAAFGHVESGLDVLDRLSRLPTTGPDGRPRSRVVLRAAQVLPQEQQ